MPLKLNLSPFAQFLLYASASLLLVLAAALFEGLRGFAIVLGIIVSLLALYYELFREIPEQISASLANKRLRERLAKIGGAVFSLFFGLWLIEQFIYVKLLATTIALIADLVFLFLFNTSRTAGGDNAGE
jgi:hypothetical protein